MAHLDSNAFDFDSNDFPKVLGIGLTFDDVLLLPSASNILPHEANITANLTSQLKLRVPILSAAMDTVTEKNMAISMARLGGLGIIHKNFSPQEQAKEVLEVKRSESGIITDPQTIDVNSTMETAKKRASVQGISSFLVVSEGKLQGILTARDLRACESSADLVSSHMTERQKLLVLQQPSNRTSWSPDLIQRAKTLIRSHRIEKVPIVNENFEPLGLITQKDLESTINFPNSAKDSLGRLLVGGAIGASPFDIEVRAPALIDAGVDVLVIDTAHGHSASVINIAKEIKLKYGNKAQIIAGNIATGAAAKVLADVGIDAVKVGIGPGSICTTRIIAGIGVPQITAIMDVKKALIGTDVKLISDGGIKFSGDIVKAIAAGADSVMLGSLLAGTNETPGDLVSYQGKTYKSYRGMGSVSAMKQGSKDRYFQSQQNDANKLVPEGIEGQVPYRGPVQDVIFQLIGGLRAGMGYTGSPTLEALQSNSRFVRITAAGLRESHVHDVQITAEAPNYTLSRS